ncbi:MAG: hypothetical protein GX817_04680 [Elusimicrobia bacterium]|nr:hypothetical protein [Elusimicrobiota bacterium]
MSKEIREDVLLEVSQTEDDRGGKVVIRVVSWNKGIPKLEKRSFWTTMDGEVRTGKIVGITAEDFEVILKNKDKIADSLSEGIAPH